MKLLVIRHALAGDSKEFSRTGMGDDLRPITDEGREQMQAAAMGIRRLVPKLDLIATSPFLRAQQTADIVAATFEGRVTELDLLRPGSPTSQFVSWLRGERGAKSVAIVGHNPHLEELVSWLLTGRGKPVIRIRKGAALMLELGPRKAINPGSAILLWSLTSDQLGRISGLTAERSASF